MSKVDKLARTCSHYYPFTKALFVSVDFMAISGTSWSGLRPWDFISKRRWMVPLARFPIVFLNVSPSVYVNANLLVLCKWNLTVTSAFPGDMQGSCSEGGKSEGWKSERGRQRFVFTLISGVWKTVDLCKCQCLSSDQLCVENALG